MGQFTSKSNGAEQGILQRVQFSVGQKGSPRYSSHHFDANSRQEGVSHQTPPTIIVSDEGSRFVLSTRVCFYFPPHINFLIMPNCYCKIKLVKW